jgi:hypothetical protein
MTSDILDERYRSSQGLPYQSTSSSKMSSPNTVLGGSSTTASQRRAKYSTHTSLSSPRPTTSSIHQRNSGSADILSIIRSIALKPFRTASMNDAVAGGHTSNVIGGSSLHNRTAVNLVRYRPLSEAVIDHKSFTQSTQVRM